MELPGLGGVRRHKNLSMRKLSEEAGIAVGTIFRVENGHETRRSTAEKLAGALEVTVEELQTGTETRQRRVVETLEWTLKRYEKRGEKSDVLWTRLHGRAALMEQRLEDEGLKARAAYVAEVSLERFSELYPDPEDIEELLMVEDGVEVA